MVEVGAHKYADLLHMMSYDQPKRHSTLSFAQSALDQALSIFPSEAHSRLTLGLPFYARNINTGEWKTYEDLVQQHKLEASMDEVAGEYFNGVEMIKRKTKLSFDKEIGGVMIWEVGQDCRVSPVTRDGTTHVKTCPNGDQDSLLAAIRIVVQEESNLIEHPDL
jgi:GH18 family chitinase